MSPKEKAFQLLGRYETLDIENNNSGLGGLYTQMSKHDAKYCALICVDEVLKSILFYQSQTEYWEQVKQEIEKL